MMKIKFEVWDVSNIKEIYIDKFETEEEALEHINNSENGIYAIRKVYIKID